MSAVSNYSVNLMHSAFSADNLAENLNKLAVPDHQDHPLFQYMPILYFASWKLYTSNQLNELK